MSIGGPHEVLPPHDPAILRDYAQAAEAAGYARRAMGEYVLGADPDRPRGLGRPVYLRAGVAGAVPDLRVSGGPDRADRADDGCATRKCRPPECHAARRSGDGRFCLHASRAPTCEAARRCDQCGPSCSRGVAGPRALRGAARCAGRTEAPRSEGRSVRRTVQASGPPGFTARTR